MTAQTCVQISVVSGAVPPLKCGAEVSVALFKWHHLRLGLKSVWYNLSVEQKSVWNHLSVEQKSV